MGFLKSLFGRDEGRDTLLPAYQAAIGIARLPAWYAEGGVADTLDGRFDMLAAITSLLLLRLEAEGEDGKAPGVLLTELFIDDMEGQLRQDGVGDVVVGKHLGRMVSALGGRLSAYRDGFADGDLEAALLRNLYRGKAPAADEMTFTIDKLRRFKAGLDAMPLETVLAGALVFP